MNLLWHTSISGRHLSIYGIYVLNGLETTTHQHLGYVRLSIEEVSFEIIAVYPTYVLLVNAPCVCIVLASGVGVLINRHPSSSPSFFIPLRHEGWLNTY